MEFSQESFERVVGSYPGEGDMGSGRYSTDTRDMGMEGFFKEVHISLVEDLKLRSIFPGVGAFLWCRALKKKLKERMAQFQTLRQNIHEEYREVVERRVFTGTFSSRTDVLGHVGAGGRPGRHAGRHRGSGWLLRFCELRVSSSCLSCCSQVTKSVDHIEKATATLQAAKKTQKNTRKYMCIAIVILLVVIVVALGGILKEAKKSA
ncbi:hypothetical protein BHE74_00044510 [Ensete ventricosum]|nr:hypothetical protein GW17_00054119 [Ensete ventricosum]RWW49344.1 hypothetical protein BHE74_00044510 [Ensete ventricosum]